MRVPRNPTPTPTPPTTDVIPPATPVSEPAHNFQRPSDWAVPNAPPIEEIEVREPVMPDKPSPAMPKVTETEAQTEVISTSAVKAAMPTDSTVAMPMSTPVAASSTSTDSTMAVNNVAAPAMPPMNAQAGVVQPQFQKPSRPPTMLETFMPEPSKAPPLEWVALGISVVLIISGFLPWFADASSSIMGINMTEGTGSGWIVMGAGLLSIAMGFLGLSRDSISLAAGQALVGVIALVICAVDLGGVSGGFQNAFGIYLAIAAAIALIGVSCYNAYDAFKKGAKY